MTQLQLSDLALHLYDTLFAPVLFILSLVAMLFLMRMGMPCKGLESD